MAIGKVWAATPRWRRRYAAAVAAIWALQTIARLILAAAAGAGTGLRAATLHCALMLALLGLLVLAVALLRLAAGRRAWVAASAAILAAIVHCFLTAFDLVNLASYYFTGERADFLFMVRRPTMVLSLLDSIGINLPEVAAALAGLLLVHVVIYFPVGRLLLDLAWAAAAFPVRIGPARLPGGAGLAAVVAALVAAYWLGPQSILRGEPFFEARRGVFQLHMAPAGLMQTPIPVRPRLAPPNPAPPGSRPLVLIVVDALRRDRMGVYDPALDTTPFLTRLARQGRLHRFDAYSTCTFSLCGAMSILASRSWNDFGSRPETVIDRLTDHSYRTRAILAGQHRYFGPIAELFGNGIVSFSDQPPGARPDDRWLLDTLRRAAIGDPPHTFLYLHLMSAHAGGFLEPAFRAHPDDDGAFGGTLARLHNARVYQVLYDYRVRQTDDIIRRIFAILQEKGLLGDALIVITSDHGERVGEQGKLYHGGEPDLPTLTIPLLVYDGRGGDYPGRPLASHIDVAPTFLAAIDLPPAPGWRGRALQQVTGRQAVPIGTSDWTGAVVRAAGANYLYLCRRSTGAERVSALDPGSRPGSANPPLQLLRRLHREAAAPVPPRCAR